MLYWIRRVQETAASVLTRSCERLNTMQEVRRAYESGCMMPPELITFGPTRTTFSQFREAGWRLIEASK